MQITRQADYATRAVLHLARRGDDQRVATGQIAQDEKIPPAFLVKIISQLSIAGILLTSRGRRGGISLARELKDITLLQVIKAVDGPVRLNECVENAGTCSFEDKCPMRLVWCDAQNDLINKLRNTSFSQLIQLESAA
jgi:Rrf2 family protein